MASLRLLQHMLPSILILASLQACMGDSTVPAQLNNDVLGLLVFKSDLHDPSSYLASWNEDDDSPCSWDFVQCNPATGRVSQLSLEGLGLLGRIGKGLQNLQHLKVLSLSNNNFSGDISTEKLALPPNLESLNLSRNSLSGLLPTALVNMSSIKFLDLSENSLSGPLPDNLFDNCFSLRYLSLSGNLLQGPLPSTLPRCSVLNGLNLSNNHFSGNPDFASGIWSLKRLRTLDFSNNAFSGSAPQGISALHNLKVLLLQGNDFSGPVPADIGLSPHLGRVDLSYNLFTGALPDSLQRLNSLTFFSLSDNMFTGDFPQWIGNMSSLKYLDFSNNGFTGSLPASIGDLKSLSYLSLSNNKLVGAIPLSLAYCNELSVIRLRDNSFSGSIPEGLFDLGLEEIDFSQMGLTGSIPPGSSRLFESLKMLDLSRNNLKGNIPAEVGLFSNLRYLNLSWNNLQSRMPPELGFFQNLTVLDLRNSALFGSIPGDICDSGSLGILQLDGNSLNGPIPNEIGNCSSLYLMSLSHNNLSGLIPKSISKLNRLKILKLEYNELSGEIPQELGRLENLLAVNISYNRHRDESPMSTTGRHHMFLSISAIVAIAAATLIVVGVIIISLLNVSARRRPAFVETALESMCSSSSRSSSLASGKLILFDSRSSPEWISSPESLLNKASEIGEGVFGTVYKIPLGVQGRVVAIKKLVTSNIIQCLEDFDREVRILGKARHPNLIALKGYYWTPQMQLLVTEFATNGSLQSKLHERLPSTLPLSWANRFKILLGAAKGLAHLHHSYRPPIIHYNIKPSNILLDENYNPKISDFALVRLLTKTDQHVVSNRFQSALGYVAPELACQSLRVNEKCDVYGFGVLILELVTGRRPVEYGEDNVVILTDHVRVLLEQGNVLGCIDLGMGEYPEDEVLPVLKLALVCTSQIPSCRPTMAEVVQIMQIIKTPIPHTLEAF
ncbi:unnamed protein product [Prunus armeniaca]|uniref:Protein kinase domain-containing protein n=1 Tax=Prunus armeniaca TaxID=36596 RepID=A0A6J5TI61_PRUAR|nr:unnamed protein product [Prunus armeniaca]